MIPIQISNHPQTVGEMVVADYRKAEIFRKFGIDYCCGGKKPLEDICLKKGIDPEAVKKELEALDQLPEEAPFEMEDWSLTQLADHIETKHHRYVAESIPILQELTAKVARVHGERHPELIEIAQRFQLVAQELQMHMMKEENILFPYIRRMELALLEHHAFPQPMFGSVQNPIRMMEAEHEFAGSHFEIIRHLSNEYTPPADSCTSYRVLFAKLDEFERDLHRHVHLENNLLFPAAIEMEQSL
ncbi:MAG: iron-sulfur cluster repair di-iron protein [Saprospiraceae bacterium]|nr:iron-sulfur cluster repair di-iron protein [Saprospiraceae bacterium]